jgi:hypothetical protein
MWLDNPPPTGPGLIVSDNTSAGSIVFGGVNTVRYTGELHTLPVPSANGVLWVYHLPAVLITGIALQADSSLSSNYESPDLSEYKILDSSVTMIYLPHSIIEPLDKDLGVNFDSEDSAFGGGYLPCSMGEHNYNITFTFTSFNIVNSMSQLLIAGDGDALTRPPASLELCLANIPASPLERIDCYVGPLTSYRLCTEGGGPWEVD